METQNTVKTYTIDAKGKRLGVIATEASSVLLGKNSADFTKHLAAEVKVNITNASSMDIPEKKKSEIYQTYSGYPSGLRSEKLSHLGKRRGYAEVLRRTISGMLPNNKLKKVLIKNLVITE